MKRTYHEINSDERPAKRQRRQPFPARRWRSASAPPAHHQRPALTEANVHAFDCISSARMPAPGSSTRRTSTKASSDTRSNKDKIQIAPKEKQALYRIFSEQRDELPEELAAHCEALKQARERMSPNARLIAAKAPEALSMTEQDGIDALKGVLLFLGVTDGGDAYVRRTAKPNLNTKFLPLAPNTTIAEALTALEQPQPDYAFGYIPRRPALTARVDPPFAQELEDHISTSTLTSEVHFPYLTAQWKSSAKGGTQDYAICQSARDGAVIVNYLHDFYTKARTGREPSVVETSHYSVTVDMRTVYVWVHWRGADGAYHMEAIASGMTTKERDMLEVRTVLGNIERFALSTRLQTIRNALNELQAPSVPGPLSAVSRRGPQAPSNPYQQQYPPPLTFASSATSSSTDLYQQPPTKRPRQDAGPTFWSSEGESWMGYSEAGALTSSEVDGRDIMGWSASQPVGSAHHHRYEDGERRRDA